MISLSLAASTVVVANDGTVTLRLALLGIRGRESTEPLVSAVIPLSATFVERIEQAGVPVDRPILWRDLRQREQDAEDLRNRPVPPDPRGGVSV